MKRQPLTPRQSDCLDAIRSYIDGQGMPPTTRELCRLMGITATHGIEEHLAALESKGWIQREPLKSRAIVILDGRVVPVRGVNLDALDGARVRFSIAGVLTMASS